MRNKKKTASKKSTAMDNNKKFLKTLSKIILEQALEDIQAGNVAPSPFLQLRAAMLDFEILYESEYQQD